MILNLLGVGPELTIQVQEEFRLAITLTGPTMKLVGASCDVSQELLVVWLQLIGMLKILELFK